MSPMAYYTIDGITITSLCYTMTLSKPTPHLSHKHPTSSLLGPVTIFSTFGIFINSFLCLITTLLVMRNDKDYIKWPAEYSVSSDWWTLSDNWESTILFCVMFNFLLFSAFIFSFGYLYRQQIYYNYILLINIAILLFITLFIYLSSTNYLSDLFHISSRQFNCKDTFSPVWEQYQNNGGNYSPGMSFNFRLKIYLIVGFFLLLSIIWQSQVMEGSIGNYIREKYYKKKRVIIRY